MSAPPAQTPAAASSSRTWVRPRWISAGRSTYRIIPAQVVLPMGWYEPIALAPTPLNVAGIVRALARDQHAVCVALVDRRRGDADKPRPFLQVGQILGAEVAHAGAQAADELVQHALGRALVRHLPLDPFRHQLEGVLHL